MKLQKYLIALKFAKNGIPCLKIDGTNKGIELDGEPYGTAKKRMTHGKECVFKEFKEISDEEKRVLNPQDFIGKVDAICKEFIAARIEANPNVVSILGFTLDPFGIVMELAECGDLKSFIEKNFETLDLTKKYRIAAGIANGLSLFNTISNLTKDDLKPENILLDGTLTPKVSGFRTAKIVDEFYKNGNGSTGAVGYQTLLEAYGLILFFIMTGEEISTDPNNSDDTASPKGVVVPKDFKDLIAACISRDMASRPTFAKVKEDLWSAYLDAEIPQEEPRGFWKEQFRGKVEVPFDEIISGAVPEKVKDILCGGRTRTITPSRFSLLYRAFGAWFVHTFSTLVNPSGFKKALNLISQEWFMEDQGAAALSNYPDGTFYVRIASASSPAPFTLECRNDGATKKLRIYAKDCDDGVKKYSVNESDPNGFDSVVSLIDSLKGEGVINTPYELQKSGYVNQILK